MYADSGYGFKWEYPEEPSKVAFTCKDGSGERHIHICYEEENKNYYRIVKESDILNIDDKTRSFLMARIVMIQEGMFDTTAYVTGGCFYMKSSVSI